MNLTDTDSASLFFDFISKLDCSRTEDRAGYLFEILTETQILKWLESSDKFWGNFNVCSPTLKKKKKWVALYDYNCHKFPKEYFEKHKNKNY